MYALLYLVSNIFDTTTQVIVHPVEITG